MIKGFSPFPYRCMKNVIDYIKKNKKHQTKLFDNYPKWRYLVSLVEDKVVLEKLIRSAALWFSENDKSGLAWLHITDLFVFEDELYIVTSRPGLIIGKEGKSINSLSKQIGVHINLIEACEKDCPSVALKNEVAASLYYI